MHAVGVARNYMSMYCYGKRSIQSLWNGDQFGLRCKQNYSNTKTGMLLSHVLDPMYICYILYMPMQVFPEINVFS